MTQSKYWGYHSLFDCSECNIDNITDKEVIYNFIKELVRRIDMVAYGEPIIEYFATHDPDKAGISVVQLIETSNITGHFVDKNGDAYIDVFSCKPYNVDDVQSVIIDFFAPKAIRMNYITRNAS